MLKSVLPATTRWCKRAIIMPNLDPPITTASMVKSYRQQILDACPKDADFTPLMTLYLTDSTTPAEICSDLITAAKLYPAGATTHSARGVTDIQNIMPVLEAMADKGMPLLVHGEVTDETIDIFDREAVFIDRILHPLSQMMPTLKIVLEHITTKHAVHFIVSSSSHIAATITPHHLLINRNAYLAGGIKPHYYCLPVAKREGDRLALIEAVMGGDKKFFLGTDSAPHTDSAKLSPCGCAGIFNAPNALICLAQLFENEGHLDRLEGFTSLYGPAFYNLPVNTDRLTLTRHDTAQIMSSKEYLNKCEGVTIFAPPIDIFWSLSGDNDMDNRL